jgi:hypothetical protein
MIIVVSLLVSINSFAKEFSKSQFNVAKDIIWAADKVLIPRELLLAVCWGEGSFRNDKKLTHADGKSFSYHTCQVKLETAQFMDRWYKNKFKANPKRLVDTKVNAFYAAQHLKYQLRRYNWNWQKAVDAYNKGTARSSKSKYVKKVEASNRMLRKMLRDLLK